MLFTEKMYEEALQNYIKAQQAYATHMDGNLNVVLNVLKLKKKDWEMKLNWRIRYMDK